METTALLRLLGKQRALSTTWKTNKRRARRSKNLRTAIKKKGRRKITKERRNDVWYQYLNNHSNLQVLNHLNMGFIFTKPILRLSLVCLPFEVKRFAVAVVDCLSSVFKVAVFF